MKVRALSMGYYDNKRRREGEVFELKPLRGKFMDPVSKKMVDGVKQPEELFSSKWMEVVDGSEEREEPVVKKAQSKKKKEEPVYEDDEVI
jgi:hypothetical protein